MHFSLKIRHLVATILMIFLRVRVRGVLPKIFLWPTTRGPQELRGPGSLNRLNRRFLRHCRSGRAWAAYRGGETAADPPAMSVQQTFVGPSAAGPCQSDPQRLNLFQQRAGEVLFYVFIKGRQTAAHLLTFDHCVVPGHVLSVDVVAG